MRYVLLALSLLLALSSPVGGLRFIACFVFLLIAAALASNALVRRRVTVTRLDPEVRSTRRQPIRDRLLLRNFLPIPVARLIVSESPRSLHCNRAHHEVTLAPAGETELQLILRSERRGEYRYGPVKLLGSDPFGFFEWERIDDSEARAIVFPMLHPIRPVDRFGAAGGSVAVQNPAYEDVTRFRSLREYVTGDEPKRINWKASAKSGRLYTTEYEKTLSVAVRVVLNLSEDDYPTRRRDQLIERAVEVAAALIFEYAKRAQPVGLVAAAELAGEAQKSPLAYDERSGWQQAETLLEVLARIRAANGSADYIRLVYGSGRGTGRRVPAGLRLFVVGPTPNDEQIGQLRALRKGRLRVELFEVESTETTNPSTLAGVLPVHTVTLTGEQIVDR